MLLELGTPQANTPPWPAKAKPTHRIAAVKLAIGAEGTLKTGSVVQIEPDVVLRVCGPGWNDKTVMVALSGDWYLVFWQDLLLEG